MNDENFGHGRRIKQHSKKELNAIIQDLTNMVRWMRDLQVKYRQAYDGEVPNGVLLDPVADAAVKGMQALIDFYVNKRDVTPDRRLKKLRPKPNFGVIKVKNPHRLDPDRKWEFDDNDKARTAEFLRKKMQDTKWDKPERKVDKDGNDLEAT